MPPRASPATTVPSISAGRPSSARRSLDLACAQQVPDARRRHALHQRHRADVEVEPSQELEVAGPSSAEAEVRARHDDVGADRKQHALDELLRPELRELEVELDHQRLVDPGLGEELEAPFERRQQLDAVAQSNARVRVEGDHCRRLAGRNRSVEHPPVAAVHPVEGA